MSLRCELRLFSVDELVCLVGVQASLVDRPALLGQPAGEAPFVLSGERVLAQLPEASAAALVDLARRASHGTSRGVRRTLARFASALADGRPMELPVARDALCLLAYDRWCAVHCGEVSNADVPATSAAAEELVVAALGISALQHASAA